MVNPSLPNLVYTKTLFVNAKNWEELFSDIIGSVPIINEN